jgi:hypothetical protein
VWHVWGIKSARDAATLAHGAVRRSVLITVVSSKGKERTRSPSTRLVDRISPDCGLAVG